MSFRHAFLSVVFFCYMEKYETCSGPSGRECLCWETLVGPHLLILAMTEDIDLQIEGLVDYAEHQMIDGLWKFCAMREDGVVEDKLKEVLGLDDDTRTIKMNGKSNRPSS
jgi:hypothetical protein